MIVRRIRWSSRLDRLMDASSIGRALGRPRTTVRKYCKPIACDVASHHPLYSLWDCDEDLQQVPQRTIVKRVA